MKGLSFDSTRDRSGAAAKTGLPDASGGMSKTMGLEQALRTSGAPGYGGPKGKRAMRYGMAYAKRKRGK